MFGSCLQGLAGAPGPPGDRGVVGIGVCLVSISVNLKKYIAGFILIANLFSHLYLQGITGIPGVGGIIGVSGEKVLFVPLKTTLINVKHYLILNSFLHDVEIELYR